MPTLQEIQERFSKDIYASSTTGAKIVLAEPGHAICELPLGRHLMNANDVPMGGAIFTLGDFAIAVAENAFAEYDTVARQSSITFLSASKGTKLIAEASCIKAGKRANLYEVSITDDTGALIAHMTGNGFTVGKFVK